MKQKKFKISSSTLFVFRPKTGPNKANETTDPTTSSVATTSGMNVI